MKKNVFIALGFSSVFLFAASNTLPAVADSSIVLRAPEGRLGATASFKSRGDIFTVDDKARDRRSAYVEFYIPSTDRRGKCEDKGGADSRPAICNYNFKENLVINWRLCVTQTACSPWKRDNTSL